VAFKSLVSQDVVQSSLSHEESLVTGCCLMTSFLVMILWLNSLQNRFTLQAKRVRPLIGASNLRI